MSDVESDAIKLAQETIAAIELGAGSEHFRYGRETMQGDAIKALGALVGDDEKFCSKCFAGMDAANHYECVDVRRAGLLALMEKHQVGASIPPRLLHAHRGTLADDVLQLLARS